MTKRKRKNTIKRQNKLEKEGRGIGKGEGFKPYTEVHDISSHGESIRSPSAKFGTEKVHHTLSRNETRVSHYSICQTVADYRTQVLLNLDLTLTIAERFGFKHPMANGLPAPMVCDIEIDLINKNGSISTHAYTVKPAQDLNKVRVLEKFSIERAYYAVQSTPWGIITDKNIPKIPTANLAYLRPYYTLNDTALGKDLIIRIGKYIQSRSQCDQQSLKSLTTSCDKYLNLSLGSSLKAILHLLARGLWKIDFRVPLQPTKQLSIVEFPKNWEEKLLWI